MILLPLIFKINIFTYISNFKTQTVASLHMWNNEIKSSMVSSPIVNTFMAYKVFWCADLILHKRWAGKSLLSTSHRQAKSISWCGLTSVQDTEKTFFFISVAVLKFQQFLELLLFYLHCPSVLTCVLISTSVPSIFIVAYKGS